MNLEVLKARLARINAFPPVQSVQTCVDESEKLADVLYKAAPELFKVIETSWDLQTCLPDSPFYPDANTAHYQALQSLNEKLASLP